VRALLFAFLSLCGSSCLYQPFVPTSSVMREVRDGAIVTPAGEAKVVLVRPSWFGPNVTLRVFDEDGRFLADVVAHSHVTFAVAAGDHVWTMLAREIDLAPSGRRLLHAHLGAGRVYFAEIDWELGEGPYLESITPRSPDWFHVRGWMRSTTSWTPDDHAFGRPVIGGLERLDATLVDAASLSANELDTHTLQVEDGAATTGE